MAFLGKVLAGVGPRASSGAGRRRLRVRQACNAWNCLFSRAVPQTLLHAPPASSSNSAPLHSPYFVGNGSAVRSAHSKTRESLTAASMRVFISECKSAPVCYCCGDRENGLLSSGGGRLCGRRMPTRHVSICCRVRPKRVDPLRLCSACADGRLGCGSRGSIPRSGISGSGMLSRMARWAKCFL